MIILMKYCSVKYISLEMALSVLASFGGGALAARLDVKSAFMLLPIHPFDFEFLGYKICNLYFIDNCLPFDCSISCSLFEKFSRLWNAGRANINECHQSMTLFTNICNELGVPLAHEKTIGPSPVLTFLGLEIDTNEMCVKISPEKLSRSKHSLQELLGKKTKIRVNIEMKEDIKAWLMFLDLFNGTTSYDNS
ncbi:hypothetical protein KUTeg_004932 [Tegillarca granosa]|uniref:Reverse transcriptase domain-containing protein n=1 Tax=Tegillarca granosa TaxID=220873 RepID=A0ABQ9FIB8_TEGGR|nr:hypothetical protein KUTeg_004932 [Tegillarca granosa]